MFIKFDRPDGDPVYIQRRHIVAVTTNNVGRHLLLTSTGVFYELSETAELAAKRVDQAPDELARTRFAARHTVDPDSAPA